MGFAGGGARVGIETGSSHIMDALLHNACFFVHMATFGTFNISYMWYVLPFIYIQYFPSNTTIS